MQANNGNAFRKWSTLVLVTVASAVIAVLVGLSVWQDDVSNSRLDEADTHTATATLLQSAKEEGAASSAALRSFVETGDQSLIVRVQEHAGAGVTDLTRAASVSGSSEVGNISSGGLGLADGAGKVIALRNAGDIPGAVAALQKLSPEFETLTASLDAAVQGQLDQAASGQSSAASANDAAAYLRIAGLGVAGLTIAYLGFLGVRTVFKRRVPGAATS